MKTASPKCPAGRSGFSLVELMVSIAVLMIIMVIIFQMLDQMQKTWKRTRQTVSEFKDARNGFEEMGRRIGQATMNAYFGYNYVDYTLAGNKIRYGNQIIRQSELHFISAPSSILFGTPPKGSGSRPGHGVFFQAPFGFCYDRDRDNKNRLQFEQLNSLLNAWGYFVEFNTDELDRPAFLNKLRNAPAPRPRYRLMEFRQPTEYLQIYKLALRERRNLNQKEAYSWFTQGLFSVNSPWNTEAQSNKDATYFRTVRPIAENIIAMIIQPRESISLIANRRPESLAPDYIYDTRRWQWSSASASIAVKTRHVLPPILDISFIAIDEASFANFALRTGISDVGDDPEIIPNEYFTKGTKYAQDFDEIEKLLRKLGLDYRIFNSSIRLRESKWVDS
jgi:uncharacterized protein (TIGR02599 family)